MERFSCMVALMAPMALCACLRPLLPLSSCLQHFPPHFLLLLSPILLLPHPKGLLPLPFFACVQCGGGRGALGCHSGTRSAAVAAAAVGGRGKSAADGCVFFSSSFFLTLYAVPRALRGKRRVDYKAGRRRKRRRRQERKKVGSTVHYTAMPLRPPAPFTPCKKETSKIA